MTAAAVASVGAVRERPILFSAPMVRAILAGAKTQTRRIVKWKPYEPGYNLNFSGLELGYYCTGVPSSGWVLRSRGAGGCWNDRTEREFCPYGVVGDRLWVRETWRAEERQSDCVDGVRFAADDTFREIENTRAAADAWVEAYNNGRHRNNWRPSIYMPRWASRIMLEVTGVRVERLQDISEEDAKAEGATVIGGFNACTDACDNNAGPCACGAWHSYGRTYARLWDSINGKRAPWSSNPWVWIVEFRRLP